MLRLRTNLFLLVVLTLAGFTLGPSLLAEKPADPKPAPQPTFPADQVAFFEKDVLPILKANCYKCHGEGKVKGGLSLLSRAGVLQGGDSGPAVSLDKPDDSLLLKAIHWQDRLEMPPTGKLPQKEIDILIRWVKAGLPWSAGGVVAAEKPHRGGVVTPEARNYWAYRPVQRPEPPAVKNTGWVKNPIDAFLLARLEEKGLTPAEPADRVALLRRVTYDLIGLPPTPEEIDAFVSDKSPNAWEKVIDGLLARPQYGEKWGRHWLDLVRFAETNGYERDGPKPFAWRYRDYVIQSFNNDKPYDRFILEQLAGDEIPGWDRDAIIATGYYRLGLWDDEPVDPKEARYNELDDYVATTGQVFLGMTLNCARCHEHKIDPITHADYYRFLAFFQDIEHYSKTRDVRSPFNLTDISPPEKRAEYEKELKAREARRADLRSRMEKIEDEVIKRMPAADQRAAEGPERRRIVAQKLGQFIKPDEKKVYDRLKAELDALVKKPDPNRDLALSVNNCRVRPPDTHVLIRGNPHALAAKVVPGFPEVLGFADPQLPEPAKDARSSGRRTVLAQWIASKQNPLTARVMMNRVWQHHFGRGIVVSANDFGKFGTPPTHPELLDWLASEFMAGDWKLKRMHKLILLSNAYQMSSKANPKALALDPANELFWRFNMRRLTAEEVRDSVLAVSDKLNLKMAGPSVYPPLPREVLAGQSRPGEGWGKSSPEEASRRSVYVYVKRSLLVPILSQHDQADTDSSCPVRYTTVVPTQALGLLNGEFSNEQAGFFAERLQREAPGDTAAQVKRAIRLATGRQPLEAEVQKDVEFIAELQTQHKLSAKDALRQYCLMVLNLNEFVYLD